MLVIIAGLASGTSKAQDFSGLLMDSNSIKSQCYLMACLDQLSTGLMKVSDQKFDTNTIYKSRIIPLKSKGLSHDLLFFKFTVNTIAKDTPTYVFCFNREFRVYYKMKGFQNNDYNDFFTYLKSTGIKLNRSYFEKENVSVEGLDMLCLLDFYRTKLNVTNKMITDADRQRYKCLQHYYGTVIIN
jgi:hypothetical protein